MTNCIMNKIKKKYQNITLAVITIILFSIAIILKKEPSWYIFILVYGLSMYIGLFLFYVFEGISIQKMQFVDSENDNQLFYCQLQLGMFGEVILIRGTFENTLNLNEIEITQLISYNTPRYRIMPLYKNREEVSIEYNVKDSIININFNFRKLIM